MFSSTTVTRCCEVVGIDDIRCGSVTIAVTVLGLQDVVTDWGGVAASDGGRAWVTFDAGRTQLTFDELHLSHGAHLSFAPAASTATERRVTVNWLRGGTSGGTLHVGPSLSVAVLKCGFFLAAGVRVYKRGHLALPNRVTLHRTRSHVNGSLTGARHLTVVDASLLFANGESAFQSLHVQARATVVFSRRHAVTADRVTVSAGGRVVCRHVTLMVGALVVEQGGRLEADGQAPLQGVTGRRQGGFRRNQLLCTDISGVILRYFIRHNIYTK